MKRACPCCQSEMLTSDGFAECVDCGGLMFVGYDEPKPPGFRDLLFMVINAIHAAWELHRRDT